MAAYPPFMPGIPGAQIINDMSGLLRPMASNADLDRLFSTSVAINAAANFWGETMSLVKMKLLDGAGQEVSADDPLVHALTDNMPDILHRSMVSEVFRGYNLLYKVRNPFNDELIRLRWMNFNIYSLDKDWMTGLRGFRVFANGTNSEPVQVNYITRREGIYWNTIDLRDDFDGVAPAEVAFMHAGVDTEIGTTALSYFQNMAIPALFIQPDKDNKLNPTEADRNDLAGLLRRVVRGAMNYGRSIISPNRWEIKELQAHFADLAMAELTDMARTSVFMAVGVPKEVLMPADDGYAKAFESRRAWLQTRFKPKAHKIASYLEYQLVKPMHPDWHVEPDFSDVPGMKEDAAVLADTINKQVAGVTMDLYTAQVAQDIEPDEALRGLYLVGGVPLPREQLHTFWQTQTGAMGSGGGMPGAGAPAPLSGTMPLPRAQSAEPMLSPRPGKSDDELWLDADQYKELQRWRKMVGKKGVDYAFAPSVLPVDSVTFGIELLTSGYDVDDAFTAIKAHVYNGKKKVTPLDNEETAFDYWQDYDTIQTSIGNRWLQDYMDKVLDSLLPRLRAGEGVSMNELTQALNAHHADLTSAWVGSTDQPGTLAKVLLAGQAAGQAALVNNSAANPNRPMALKAAFDVNWALAPKEAQAFVDSYVFNLIRELDNTTREQVRKIIADWLAQGGSVDDLKKQLTAVFKDEARAQAIASTESTRAYFAGTQERYKQAGVKQGVWNTVNVGLNRKDKQPGDVCAICTPLHKAIGDMEQGWWSDVLGQYVKPPSHVNCRCWVKPYMGDN